MVMLDVRKAKDSPVYIGVAVKKTREKFYHVGIIYRDKEKSNLRILHLAFHHQLENEELNNEYFHVYPDILPLKAEMVAAFCRRIYLKNRKKIPYGYSQPPNFFLATGEMNKNPAKIGLTCASFVLAAYFQAGSPLVLGETWESRSDDVDWQNEIISIMKSQSIDQSHIDNVKKEIGNIRYRPLEVAGAATITPLPAKFHEAVAQGEIIKSNL